MNCPNCQSENKDSAKYCNECGFPLSGRIAELAAAANVTVPAESAAESAIPSTLPATEAEDESADAADNEPVSPKHASEPLTPTMLPSIEVAGVNVDEDGKPFDFTPYDEDSEENPPEELASQNPEQETEPVIEPADATVPVVLSQAPHDDKTSEHEEGLSADRTADLSGIERLVEPGYVAPAASWRSGDTMEMPAVEGDASKKQKEFRAPDSNQKKKRGKGVKVFLIAALVVLLAAGVAAAVTYRMELWGGRTVPDVVGKSQADAIFELESRGFEVRTTQVKSDDVEGKVLLTDPSAGSRQGEGAEVVIHMSVSRVVPEVEGLSRDEAAALFETEEFKNVEYQTMKSDQPEGSVIAVDPVAGSKAKATTHILVQVATPYTVPDVIGQNQDGAEAALAEAGFAVYFAWVYDENVAEGLVVSTDPAADSKLASGSTVTVNLAKSRATELISATQTFFNSGGLFVIDEANYEVQPETLEVKYVGDDVTSYSISARVVEARDYLFFGTQTLYGEWKTISGSITWDNKGNAVFSDPKIAHA